MTLCEIQFQGAHLRILQKQIVLCFQGVHFKLQHLPDLRQKRVCYQSNVPPQTAMCPPPMGAAGDTLKDRAWGGINKNKWYFWKNSTILKPP